VQGPALWPTLIQAVEMAVWHDICSKFNENLYWCSTNIKFCLRNVKGCNVDATDGSDLWITALRLV
jgi:hypothetical protein